MQEKLSRQDVEDADRARRKRRESMGPRYIERIKRIQEKIRISRKRARQVRRADLGLPPED